MKQTAVKVIDLQEYRKSKQELLDELNELQQENKAQNKPRPIWTITMPYQYQQNYIIPDVYLKRWNRFWAIGFTIFVIIGLL